MSEEAGPDPKRSRRLSGEPALYENIQFPELTKFNPPDKLPTIASVIGRLRYLMGGGKKNMEKERALREVAKEVEAKYYHDTIYCKSLATIIKELRTIWTSYSEGKKVAKAGKITQTKAKAYICLLYTSPSPRDS